jgi:heterodisulfide reductase subunit B
MPYKDVNVRKKKAQEYSRKNYEVNYEKRRTELSARRKELKEEWSTFKRTLKCTKCGFNHIAALDFHHEDPSEKEYNVNRLVSNGQFKKAYEEIKKCIVLCANCHRIHHYEEKEREKAEGQQG